MRTDLQLGLQLKNDLNDKGIKINDNYVIKVFGTSIEFILDNGEGKRVFGGDVNVSGFRNAFEKDGARAIQINTCTMGSVDNTCTATVESTLLMAAAFTNWEEFAKSCEVVMDEFESIAIK